MAITISGSGITSANIADGTITTDDILASDVKNLKSGRKNLIINGGFDVWQRGTSQTGVVDSVYQTVDRFKGRRSTVTADITKGTSTLPDNSKVNTFKITATSSATGFMGLSQAFEQSVFDYIDNRTVTLSCWIKTNRTDITFRHASINNFSVGSYNADGTWQKISGTYTVPAGSASMQFDILTFANSTSAHTIGDYFEIANVQLELGSVATDFEHRSYGEELALCQRYYQKWENDSAGNVYNINLQVYAGGAAFGKLFDFPVVMRTLPTVTISGTFTPHNASGSPTTAFNNQTSILATTQGLSTGSWSGSNGLVAGNATSVRVTAGSVITLNAEL